MINIELSHPQRHNKRGACVNTRAEQSNHMWKAPSRHWSNPSLEVFPDWRWMTDQSTDKPVMD